LINIVLVNPKPYKEYKNFQNFLEKFGHGKCICPYCSGLKKIVAPGEERDPIEGHKLSRRIPCPRCQGTGEIPLEDFKKLYRKERETYLKSYRSWKHRQEIYASILKKLNNEELKLLGLR